jgi:hypothetical protein
MNHSTFFSTLICWNFFMIEWVTTFTAAIEKIEGDKYFSVGIIMVGINQFLTLAYTVEPLIPFSSMVD